MRKRILSRRVKLKPYSLNKLDAKRVKNAVLYESPYPPISDPIPINITSDPT